MRFRTFTPGRSRSAAWRRKHSRNDGLIDFEEYIVVFWLLTAPRGAGQVKRQVNLQDIAGQRNGPV